MIIEVEKTYYKRFYTFLAAVDPELNIEEDVDKYIYEMDQISDRYEKEETRKFLNYYVLPLAAIYKGLQEQLKSEEAIELIEQFLLNEIAKRDGKVFGGKGLVGRLTGTSDRIVFQEFNARNEGWKITWLYNNKSESACNVEKCLIYDILDELECKNLMPIVCNVEYQLMERLQNGQFSRAKCIGLGDEYCDFVFEEK